MECSSWVLMHWQSSEGQKRERLHQKAEPVCQDTGAQRDRPARTDHKQGGHKPGGKAEVLSIKDLPFHAALHNGSAPQCMVVHAVA